MSIEAQHNIEAATSTTYQTSERYIISLTQCAISKNEIGTELDSDQLFYQRGFKQGDVVASFSIKAKESDEELFSLNLAVRGEQTVFSQKDGDDYEMVCDEPKRFLELKRQDLLEYGMNCWIEIDLGYDTEVYNVSSSWESSYFEGNILSSISEMTFDDEWLDEIVQNMRKK